MQLAVINQPWAGDDRVKEKLFEIDRLWTNQNAREESESRWQLFGG